MVRIINIDTKARTIRVSNGKDDLEWFTTDTGSHVPLKKGQSKAEAIKEHFGNKKDKDSGKAISAAKKEMLARHAKERKALRDSSSRLGDSYYKQRVNELIKQQEIEEQDFYEGHGIQAPKSKQKISRDDVTDKSGGPNETLDQMLTTGGLTKYERYRMDKMMEHHDIKPEDIIAVLESGEYTPEQVLETVDNYDNEEAILHMLDVAKGKQKPSKKETPDTSNADYFKSTMQETMKKFPRLYEHEQKHLEEYAVSAFSALRNNPGKEKAIVDEILDSYNQHVKRLGMWVDTPTLAKKAFVEKLAEAYK